MITRYFIVASPSLPLPLFMPLSPPPSPLLPSRPPSLLQLKVVKVAPSSLRARRLHQTLPPHLVPRGPPIVL